VLLIRPYRGTDAPAVRGFVVGLQEFERRIDPRLRPGDAMATEYLRDMLARCVEHAGMLLVAEVDSIPVGFATVLTRVPFESLDDPPGEFALVSDLFVDDRFRRQGVGVALLAEAERLALSAGAQELRINALAGNPVAAGLYERAGFSPYLHTMAKRLSP
jgi:GNAT superfamily N-acetyltransferase